MKPTSQELAAAMAEKTDEQLREMFAERSDWTAEALWAAQAELDRRGVPLPPGQERVEVPVAPATCFFCETNPAEDEVGLPVDMFRRAGPVSPGRIAYVTARPVVPRCESCEEAHSGCATLRTRPMLFLAFLSSPFVPMAGALVVRAMGISLAHLGDLFDSEHEAGLWAFIWLGLLAWVIYLAGTVYLGKAVTNLRLGNRKPADWKYRWPVLGDMLKQGWLFGIISLLGPQGSRRARLTYTNPKAGARLAGWEPFRRRFRNRSFGALWSLWFASWILFWVISFSVARLFVR